MNIVKTAFAVVSVATAVGCGGWVTVDGYDAAYVDAPLNIESYPHYTYEGGEVYEVNGHYYHHGGDGRWVQFRSRPVERRATVQARPEEHRDVRPEEHHEEEHPNNERHEDHR